jgi:hypothetical protein
VVDVKATLLILAVVMGQSVLAADKKPLIADPAEDPNPFELTSTSVKVKRPNFVILFTDDRGYGDLSCFGGKHVSTPRIDRMAKAGQRLTSFYVAAPVCTPSRAAHPSCRAEPER